MLPHADGGPHPDDIISDLPLYREEETPGTVYSWQSHDSSYLQNYFPDAIFPPSSQLAGDSNQYYYTPGGPGDLWQSKPNTPRASPVPDNQARSHCKEPEDVVFKRALAKLPYAAAQIRARVQAKRAALAAIKVSFEKHANSYWISTDINL